jgi:hypothetical protein
MLQNTGFPSLSPIFPTQTEMFEKVELEDPVD